MGSNNGYYLKEHVFCVNVVFGTAGRLISVLFNVGKCEEMGRAVEFPVELAWSVHLELVALGSSEQEALVFVVPDAGIRNEEVAHDAVRKEELNSVEEGRSKARSCGDIGGVCVLAAPFKAGGCESVGG
jgi:hypothetical protein